MRWYLPWVGYYTDARILPWGGYYLGARICLGWDIIHALISVLGSIIYRCSYLPWDGYYTGARICPG